MVDRNSKMTKCETIAEGHIHSWLILGNEKKINTQKSFIKNAQYENTNYSRNNLCNTTAY